MKMYMKIAILSFSIATTPLLPTQEISIEVVHNLEQTVRTFEKAISLMCLKGEKDGLTALLTLGEATQTTLQSLLAQDTADDAVVQKAKSISVKFIQLIQKVCGILKSNKPLNEITLELSQNFDVKKMFPEVLQDLQQLLALAQKNNYPELVTLIEDLSKQIQVEQKKWANPPVTALAKFVQSIKAYFKR